MSPIRLIARWRPGMWHSRIYVAGPVLGAFLAIPACCSVRDPGCTLWTWAATIAVSTILSTNTTPLML
jgi:hypothetical protein